jgi:hypothetical protein
MKQEKKDQNPQSRKIDLFRSCFFKALIKRPKYVLIIFFVMLLAIWLLTWSRPAYMAFPYGKGTGKVIIVKQWLGPLTPISIPGVDTITELFARIHWKRPILSWTYDIATDKLVKENWALKEMNFLNEQDPPMVIPSSGQIITNLLDDTGGHVKSQLRFLMPDGKVEFVYHHDEMITDTLLSPDGKQIFFEDYQRRYWIYDIPTRHVREIKELKDENCHFFKWPQGGRLYYIGRRDIKKDEKGS